MKLFKRLFACVVLSGAAFESYSAPIFYDSFNYSPVGTQLSTAGSPTWGLRVAGAVDPKIAAGSLSYPGLQTTPGDNSVAFDGLGGAGVSGRALGQVYNPTNIATLYYSLTFQVATIAIADWGGSGNFLSGSFMLGFAESAPTGALNAPNVGAPLLIRTGDPTNATGTANDFQGFQLGTGVTAATGPPTSRVFDGARVYTPGVTLFLVASYTFGPAATDDVARLWVNPIPGSLESDNTPVVTASGVTDIANNQIQSFFLRNNSVEPSSTVIDDLRVGTSWADVTPIPEPSSFGVLVLGAAGLLVRRLRRKL